MRKRGDEMAPLDFGEFDFSDMVGSLSVDEMRERIGGFVRVSRRTRSDKRL